MFNLKIIVVMFLIVIGVQHNDGTKQTKHILKCHQQYQKPIKTLQPFRKFGGVLERKIINGFAIDIINAPYQASLQARMNATFFKNICGAAIISPTWLISAAHCFTLSMDLPVKRVITSRTETFAEGIIHQIKRVIPHEKYSNEHKRHDIGLIELSQPIVFDSKTQPIGLPTRQPQVGDVCITTGFGRLEYQGAHPTTLQAMITKILPNKVCAKRSKYYNPQTMFCTRGNNSTTVGFCAGDSGSALVCNGQVFGIVSFKVLCRPQEPDYYATVFHSLRFIKKYTNL